MITNLISKQIWGDRYRKNNESFNESIERVAKYVSTNEKECEEFKKIMLEGLFYPAGRTMSNSGIGKTLTLNNCFTLNLVPDSMEGIFDYVKYGAITQKAGGGTGYNFSLLRPNGTPTSNDAVASGVVSFMNAFDSQTHTVLQGSRRGANMGCLCIYHPDIYDFLESKSWDEGRLTHFNLSVLVDDNFMKAVENNQKIYLRYPCMSDYGEIINEESKWKTKKEVDAKELWDLIITKAYNTGEYGVLYYDNMNENNNLYYMENIVTTNPCAEYISGILYDDEGIKKDYMGACNLGSLFLHNFVIAPFTKDAKMDYDRLQKVINVAVRMLDNIIDINNYPLKQFENYQKNIRTIGLGITGLADTFAMLNMKYGSEESIKFTDELMNFISLNAYDTSCDLAKEKGSFNFLDKNKFVESNFIKKHIEKYPEWEKIKDKILFYGIRNGRLISVAPAGTLSLSYGNNCSSSLEPIFSLEYDRQIKIGGQDDENIEIFKMRDYVYEKWLEFNSEENIVDKNKFVTAMELSVDDHVNILSTVSYHVDMSCSKTINIPTEYSFEDTKDVYTKCWENGISGCTIFRPNEIRKGILTIDNEKDNKEKEQLLRGEWESRPESIIEIRRKIKSGCGSMTLHIGIIPTEKRIFDFYITNSSKGGCALGIQNLAIAMSHDLRIGGNLKSLEKSFKGAGTCPSYVRAKGKGIEVSKGNSCGASILYCLLDVENDLQEEVLKELVDLNYYNHDKQKETEKNALTKEDLGYIKEYGESAFASRYHKCPECGEELSTVGSCLQCKCGFSKC